MASINIINETEKTAEFVSSFEKGLALPVGNGLRRILLSSISGCAITAVSIIADSDTVLHEFQAVNGVKEDMTEIILNLKKIVFRSDIAFAKDENLYATMTVTGPKAVTAGDISTGIGLHVINKDEYICTVGPGHTLEMDFMLSRGRGTEIASEGGQKEDLVWLRTDAIYNPVRKVNVDVCDTTPGEEELHLTVETNGALSPRDAVSEAAAIYMAMSNVFNIKEKLKDEQEDEPEKITEEMPDLQVSVEELAIGQRALNCLRRKGIRTVEDLVGFSVNELLQMRGMGNITLNEIITAARNAGYSFKDDEADTSL